MPLSPSKKPWPGSHAGDGARVGTRVGPIDGVGVGRALGVLDGSDDGRGEVVGTFVGAGVGAGSVTVNDSAEYAWTPQPFRWSSMQMCKWVLGHHPSHPVAGNVR